MQKLRFGMVGCRRGGGLVKLLAEHPEVEITAICDIKADSLAALGETLGLGEDALYLRYEDFIEAPLDAVVIATPIPFHAEQTLMALKRDLHVLCEQTLAYTVEDCARIVDAVKESGCTFMMAENYTYFHYIRQWREIIDSGRLGRVLYAEGEYIHEIIDLLVDKESGRYYWRHDRPPIWYCAHTLGPLLLMMDDRIVQACGLTTGFNRLPEYADHPGFMDIEVGLFKTEKGSVIKILRSQVAARPHMVWYSLYGTNGHLENSRLPKSNDGMVFIEGEMDKQNPAPVECSTVDPNAPEGAGRGGHGTSEFFMVRDFLEAIKSGQRPPIDVIRAADMTIPGLIAHQSALKGGEWMDVPLMNW